MPRVDSKSLLSLQPVSPSDKSFHDDKNLTPLTVINKLKQTQLKIMELKSRQKVIKRHQSKEHLEKLEEQRKRMFYQSVKLGIEQEKQLKKQAEVKKQKQLEQRFSLNMSHRERNRQALTNVRKNFIEMNQSVYQQTKQKKLKFDEQIKKFKYHLLQEKADHRKKEAEKQDQRRKSIRNFYNNKVISIKKEKHEETRDFLRKLDTRSKYLEGLSSRNSRYRQTGTSRVSSSSVVKNPEGNSQTNLSQSINQRA